MSLRIALAVAATALALTPAEAQPNMMLFMPDDFGFVFDEAPVGGEFPSAPPAVPNMDRVREEGAVFERAYTASPKCAPSRFSLLTGRYASRGEYARAASVQRYRRDPTWEGRTYIEVPQAKMVGVDTQNNLQTALSRAGYETIFSGKWHLFPTSTEHLEDYSTLVRDINATGFTKVASAYATNLNGGFGADGTGHTWSHNTEWLVNTSLTEVAAAVAAEKPFFLYLAPTGPHSPNTASAFAFDARATPAGMLAEAPYTTMRARADVWAAATLLSASARRVDSLAGHMWVDDALGAMLDGLEDLEVLDSTIVVICMDHGTVGKSSLTETGTRIMQAVRYPVEVEAGSHVASAVVNTDTTATLADYAGVTAAYAMDGVSWRAEAAGGVPVTTVPKAMEMYTDRTVVAWPYKYTVAGSVSGMGELYNLLVDPAESTDVAGLQAYADVRLRMQEYMRCHDASTTASGEGCTAPEIPNGVYVP